MRIFSTSLLLMAFLLNHAQKDVGGTRVLWEPPRIDWPESKINGVVVHSLSVAGFPIVLDKTLLENARRHLGGSTGSRGDAGDFEQWLCLHGSNANGAWLLWLTSDEINGGAVGGFIWERVGPGQPFDKRCASLTAPSPVSLQVPLRLGMTKAESVRILGVPMSSHNDSMFYVHERKKKVDGSDFTISNGVEVKIGDGRIVQIAAFEISSN